MIFGLKLQRFGRRILPIFIFSTKMTQMATSPPATTKEQRGNFFSLFAPREGFFITPILVGINLAVFIMMVVSGADFLQPGNQSLIQWGANIRSLTLDGQWWRIISNLFVHIGVFHVLFNMYALLYIGVLLEPLLGRLRFLSAYLLTGIIASLASLYWHPNTLSAGASGAIFGMYGVFLALLTTNWIDKTQRTALLTSIVIFVGYNLLYGMKGSVDNAAHIGGLVSGILIGYLYYPGLRKPENPRLRYSAVVLATLLVGVVTVLAFKKIPNDYSLFQRKMNAFSRLERKALDVLQPKGDVSKTAWLNAIRDTGISNWKESIRILNEANQLDVPDPLKKETVVLVQYCHLRIQSYDYIYRKLTDSASSGPDSVAYFNAQISELMESLKSRK